jgi:hypothetical protein
MPPIALLLSQWLLAVVPPAASSLTLENCDFGETYAFNDPICEIAFGNAGDKPIRVFDIVPVNAKDSAKSSELIIAPHSHAYLPVRFNVDNLSGYSSHTFRFHTNELGHEEGRVNVRGFVLSALDQPKPEVDFGVVDLNADLPERSLDLNSHDTPSFRVVKVLEKPNWLDATISPDGRKLSLRIRADVPWGLHAEFVKLAIDTPKQKQAWVLATANVHGDIVPASNPFNMGLLRVGNRNEFRIPLVSRLGKPLAIGKIELESVKGETKVTPCQPEAGACRWLELTISDKQPLGTIKGNLWIDLPDKRQRLQIALRGLLVDKDFKVNNLDANALPNKTTDQPDGVKATNAQQAATDLNKSIKNAVQQANEVAPPGKGPLLKWTVANGRLIYGFQIFRAESEEGPFVLHNSATILANAEDDAPTSYQWRDSSAESGKTYWYYIGIVNKDGNKQQLSGPQKVVAK